MASDATFAGQGAQIYGRTKLCILIDPFGMAPDDRKSVQRVGRRHEHESPQSIDVEDKGRRGHGAFAWYATPIVMIVDPIEQTIWIFKPELATQLP